MPPISPPKKVVTIIGGGISRRPSVLRLSALAPLLAMTSQNTVLVQPPAKDFHNAVDPFAASRPNHDIKQAVAEVVGGKKGNTRGHKR